MADFRFGTLVADFGFWTVVADLTFWTFVPDFRFRTLVCLLDNSVDKRLGLHCINLRG